MSRGEAVERAKEVARQVTLLPEAADRMRRMPPEALKVIPGSALAPLVRTCGYGRY